MKPGSDVYLDQRGIAHSKPAEVVVAWRLSGYIVSISKGRLLMVQSSWGKLWELPGGGIEPGESLTEGTLREGHEETGLNFKFLELNPFAVTEGKFYLLEERAFCHSIRFYFRAEAEDERGDPSVGFESGEIINMHWIDLKTLNEETIHPIHRHLLSELRQQE